MSPVIDTRDDDGRERGIRAAVDAVRDGHLVVLPTDTVYGVGADAFDEKAVAALLEAKGRGREMPPPVLVPSPRTIDGLAVGVPLYARTLVDEFWPGALTLVLRAQASLMWDLGDTNGTVAVRMPDDGLTLAVLSETGPLAVTSANRTGEPAARTAADAASQLGASVTVYLDDGPSGQGEASTIVDCTGDSPVVLRHGAISEQEIRDVLTPAGEKADPDGATGEQPDRDEPGTEQAGTGQPDDEPKSAPSAAGSTTPEIGSDSGLEHDTGHDSAHDHDTPAEER